LGTAHFGSRQHNGGALSLPICQFLRRISCSLYLLHFPIFSAALAFDNRALDRILATQQSHMFFVGHWTSTPIALKCLQLDGTNMPDYPATISRLACLTLFWLNHRADSLSNSLQSKPVLQNVLRTTRHLVTTFHLDSVRNNIGVIWR
jgi:hypothetical protein